MNIAWLARGYWNAAILKYNGFSDRAPCTNLNEGEQKDRTKTSFSSMFPDHILNDYDLTVPHVVTNKLLALYKHCRQYIIVL